MLHWKAMWPLLTFAAAVSGTGPPVAGMPRDELGALATSPAGAGEEPIGIEVALRADRPKRQVTCTPIRGKRAVIAGRAREQAIEHVVEAVLSPELLGGSGTSTGDDVEHSWETPGTEDGIPQIVRRLVAVTAHPFRKKALLTRSSGPCSA
jgi:hypothetical protein